MTDASDVLVERLIAGALILYSACQVTVSKESLRLSVNRKNGYDSSMCGMKKPRH